jgi:hypothetical protein
MIPNYSEQLILKIAYSALFSLRGGHLWAESLLDPTTFAPENNDISERNRTDSPLLRLPAELRNKIFALAFGGLKIFIRNTRIDVSYNSRGNADFIRRPFAGLQGTCRQIYVETALLPFSEINEFWYYTTSDLDILQDRFAPAQVKAISTVFFNIVFNPLDIVNNFPDRWGNFDRDRLVGLEEFEGLQKVIVYYKKPFDPQNVKEELVAAIQAHSSQKVQVVFRDDTRYR